MERLLHRGVVKDCVYPLLGFVRHIDSYFVKKVEKFLHRGNVERVLYRGSMDNCVDPLLGIEHHNDSYAMVV